MDRSRAEIIQELLLEHMRSTAVMQTDVQEIKTDLKHYVAKTEKLEQQTKELHGQMQMAKGSIAFISLTALVASIWKTLKP